MQTNTEKSDFRKEIDGAMNDLEQLADEVRVKVHLAELDARDAKQATTASKAAIEATVKAFRDFAQSL